MKKQDFHPNLVRQVEAQDLPVTKKFRLKEELDSLKFERLRRELRDRSDKDSDQATLEFVLNLAWSKFQELEDLDKTIDRAAK